MSSAEPPPIPDAAIVPPPPLRITLSDGAREFAVRLDVYHHVDHRIVEAIEKVARWLVGEPGPAVAARLTVGEKPEMTDVSINVDTTNEIATVTFVDDHGDTDAAAPAAGVIATFASSDPNVLTIANNGENPLQGDITVVGEGQAAVSVTLTDGAGNPLYEADGVTPWATPDPTNVAVLAGAAVGARLSVSP